MISTAFLSAISLMHIVIYISLALMCLIILLGLPSILYIFIGLLPPKKFPDTEKRYRYACIICARNESAVIGDLIESIKKQDYPAELIDIFVVADNCSDNTAQAARDSDANYVFERVNQEKKGKCYALQYILDIITNDYQDQKGYKGYFYFDADNLLKHDYITQMNKAVAAGEKIINSHRLPKNYDNWLAAGTGLMFLEQSRFVHYPRAKLGVSTYIAGTGFYTDAEIIKKQGGWPYTAITEDVEFSHAKVLEGYKITHCADAAFYDDQASKVKEIVNQRARWVKGNYQCCNKFALKHIGNIHRSFASYDLLFLLLPIPIITFTWSILAAVIMTIYFLVNSSAIFMGAQGGMAVLLWLGIQFVPVYILASLLAALVTICEWKNIKAPAWKKILYIFTFAPNMLLYLPSVYMGLGKVKWKTIKRSNKKLSDLEKAESGQVSETQKEQ